MDLARLKLQLIQQIIVTDDPALLEKIRRILDEAEANVVAEGEAPYFKLEDRMYSAAEVQVMLNDLLKSVQDAHDPSLDQKEWSELDADHAAYLRGEGSNYSWEEVKEQLRRDREA
ncbi:MAG: hypothetical protein M3R08_07485 [Bacteroidota bacterium]|nr:hypothetical protein [Bacteroidota bacterium]